MYMRSAEFNEDRIAAFADRMKIEPEQVIAEQRARRRAVLSNPVCAELGAKVDAALTAAFALDKALSEVGAAGRKVNKRKAVHLA